MRRALAILLALCGAAQGGDSSGTLADFRLWHDFGTTVAGDTFTLDPGTYSVATQVEITKGINLIGSGMGDNPAVDTILEDDTANTAIIVLITAPSTNYRVSNMRLANGTRGPGDGARGAIKCEEDSHSIRIDHIYFDGLNVIPVVTADATAGLVDNCHIETRASSSLQGWRIQAANYPDGVSFSYSNGSWMQPLDLGGPTAWYFEDNYIHGGIEPSVEGFGDTYSGAREVIRFNVAHYANVGTHGTSDGQGVNRGPPKIEVYHNLFAYDEAKNTCHIRGGSGVYFGNQHWETVSPLGLPGLGLEDVTGSGTSGPGQSLTLHYYRAGDPGNAPDVISSITSTASDFTVTTATSHGLSVGEDFYIGGATPGDYNGLWTVATAPSGTVVTVTSALNPGPSTVHGAAVTAYPRWGWLDGETMDASGVDDWDKWFVNDPGGRSGDTVAGDGDFWVGTVSSGGLGTLTQTGAGWDEDEWDNYHVICTSADGANWPEGHFYAVIDSNTAETLTFGTGGPARWDTQRIANAGQTFTIRRLALGLDQPGAGAPTDQIGDVDVPEDINQPYAPWYSWNNVLNQTNAPGGLISDWHHFNEVPLATFQASPDSGMAVGTKAQMEAITPTLLRTGFWVTDEGEWWEANAGFDGQLYQWDGDSWELYYTPYTYPHPLRDDPAPPPEEPDPPAASTATTVTADTVTVTGP